MTTALYRRYRPDTFQDVIGQDHVTAPLMAALRGDRVTHAYLFSGPRGCGKTTSARILARCLNCERFPTDTPCGRCPSCRDLATGGPGSLDVVEIDAASHNGVDDARDLRERASFAPARDRFKIFILDEAHMVTPQGFNALLKLVEEPPAHVKFVFATTEPEKVIGTIRSRTHHYPFRLVAPDALETYLAHLCGSEGVRVGPGVFPLVTRAGGGSVRDTLSVMDQLIGGAVDGDVDYTRAVALLGYTDTTLLDSCVDALAACDGAGVFRVVDRIVSSGHDPRRFVEDLLQRLRDLLVIALAGSEAGPALGSLPADELTRMEGQSRTIGAAGLSRAADVTAQALSQMVGATSPRLQLELLMARLLVADQRVTVPAAPAPAAPPAVRPGGGGAAAEVAHHASRPAADAPPTARPAAPPAQPAAAVSPAAPAAGTGRGASSEPDAHAPSAPAPSASSAPTAESPVPRRAAEADREAPAQAGAPQRPARAGTGSAADAEMIRDRWEEVLEAAKRSRRATWALVGPNSQPGGINGGVFEVIFTGQGLVNAFENGGHGPVLSRALHQALGLRLEAHAVLGGPSGGGRDGGPGGPHGGRGPAGWPDGAGSDGHRSSPDGVAGGGGRPESSGGRFGESVRGGAPAGTAAEASANGGTPPSADEIAPPESEDDGWGVIAVPGAARAARESAADSAAPAPAGHSVDSADAPGPPGPSAPGSAPAPPVPSPAAAPAPMASAAASAPSPSASPVPSAGPVDGAEPVCPERAGGEPPLATVHRLRALPDLPGGASSSSATPEAASADRSGLSDRPDRHGLDPVSWDSPDTFSDGTPVPQEPPPEDEDDPEDSWAPSGAVHDRLSAARAAARAAAGGHSAQSAGRAAGAAFSPLEDDVPSEDDEDAEEAGIVGLEVVKRLLGATVLEEITVTQEGR